MRIVNVKSMKQAKNKIKESLLYYETTIIKVNGKQVAVISNCPNAIYDIFYMTAPSEFIKTKINLEERIREALKNHRIDDDEVIIDQHVIDSALVDTVKITHGEDIELVPPKGITTPWEVPRKPMSWAETVKYVNKHKKEQKKLLQRCYAKIQIGEVEFNTTLTPLLSENDRIFVFTEENLRKHGYFRSCMSALDLCKYLIHFNITDVYDSFTTDGIKKHALIAQYESFGSDVEVYDCGDGFLYVEAVVGVINRDIIQAVFIDNEFVRNNLNLIPLLDFNFIGLKPEMHPEVFEFIDELDCDEQTRENLKKLSAEDLRAIKHIKPYRDNEGNFVFAIGDYKIITFPPEQENLIVRIMNNF